MYSLHVCCIDVINFIIIVGCNVIVMVLMLIILDGQVHKILVCSRLILCFLSRGYQVGVYFLALCFRGFSPCILVDFPGLGAAGLVYSGGRLLSRCSFHFRRG